jgi:ribosomal protein S18 acetylase RimI-like enzyme
MAAQAAFNPREYQIARPLPPDIPWPLLLEADPSEDRVRAYLDEELFRVAWRDGEIAAAYVLAMHEPTRYELMNLAVRPVLRGIGLGRWMLGHAIGLAESKGARTIEAGIAPLNRRALAFLQSNGFRLVGEERGRNPSDDHSSNRAPLRLRLALEPEY